VDTRLREVAVAATKSYLRQLMTAAAALPGIATGATPIDKGDVNIDFKHVIYEEQDDLMQVDAEYLNIGLALSEKNDLQVALEYETMSGASPIFNAPGIDGDPVVVKSGASITDERTAVSAKFRHFFDKGTLTVAPSWSDENDYTSNALTLQYEWDINNKNTTLAVGAGIADDQVWANGQDTKNDREGTSAFLGVTQILNTKSLFQANLSFAQESGFLSDPYKLVQVQDSILEDTRPDDRSTVAGLLRYIRTIGSDASIHLSYRYFSDDWSIQSHTLEASWYSESENGWLLNPSLRYYSQDAAEFYQPYFVEVRDDGFYSSDFRLAGFGSIMAGVKIGKKLASGTSFDLGLEYYSRDGVHKIGGEHSLDPEPLSSYVISLGIKHTF
jgi:hypothetical protein